MKEGATERDELVYIEVTENRKERPRNISDGMKVEGGQTGGTERDKGGVVIVSDQEGTKSP